MKIISKATILPLLVLAGFAASPAAVAQTSCDDVDFSSALTDRFPRIADACLGIVTRDDGQYVHLAAEIIRVSGNTVRARFQHPDGGYSDTYSIDVSPDARVTIDGRQYRYRELGRGSKVDVYIPQDRWAVHIPENDDFATAPVETVAVTTAVMSTDDEPAMLPSTASPLPLIGMLGGLFTALGFGLVVMRRRFS